jgi:hypothetical protein
MNVGVDEPGEESFPFPRDDLCAGKDGGVRMTTVARGRIFSPSKTRTSLMAMVPPPALSPGTWPRGAPDGTVRRSAPDRTPPNVKTFTFLMVILLSSPMIA